MIGGLIIAGRACEQTPFRIDLLGVFPINILSVTVAHDGLPRFALPLGGIDRLPIVMRVKRDRSFRIRGGKIGDHDGRSAFHRQEFHGEATLLAQSSDCFGVALNVRLVVREVRDGKQLGELGENLFLVSNAPGAGLIGDRSGLRARHSVDEQDR